MIFLSNQFVNSRYVAKHRLETSPERKKICLVVRFSRDSVENKSLEARPVRNFIFLELFTLPNRTKNHELRDPSTVRYH